MIRSLSRAWSSNGFFQFNRFKSKKSPGNKSPPANKGSGSSSSVSASVLKTLDVEYEKLKNSKSKSLLKKYLTPDVFKKLRTKRTKSSTLLDCIQSGLKNHDSGCGVYAADAEAYKVFADLFDPIISDYHFGFKKTDKHPARDFGNPCKFGDLDPHINYIASTRIRCARSVKGYPFNPCMTKQNYDDLEDLVHCTLTGLDDEFKGTYYPLLGMKKSIQKKLIDDHFLFKEGDRFLQAANASRFWPTGRGIYHNYDKTFLVWCNEEDHIRIISMQRGGNFRQVFTRLVRGVNAVGKKIDFIHDDRLGFLTFCPTNLGTTIRASVHIRVPRLASNPKKFEAIAAKYKLQVRGTRGEHSDAEGGIYDVSNKRRMGLTEYQAVREIYKGITELIALEKSEKGPAKSGKSAKKPCTKTGKTQIKKTSPKDLKTCYAKTCSKSSKKSAPKPPTKCKKSGQKAATKAAAKPAPKAPPKKNCTKAAPKKQPPPKAAQKKPPPKNTKKTPKKPDPKGKKPGKK